MRITEMPLPNTSIGCLFQACLVTGSGLITALVGVPALQEVGLHEWVPWTIAITAFTIITLEILITAKWWHLRNKTTPKKRVITLGGMEFDEKALFTNILVFGSIGSGKTAAVVYPTLEAITELYQNEDPNAPDAKWGGFVLDVKGDFHEAVIYVMEKYGRDTLKDLVVIRPDNDYYILEFEDIETGNHFLVSCMGGTTLQECDLVLNRAIGSPDILHTDSSGNKYLRITSENSEQLNSFMFSDRGIFRRPEVHQQLIKLQFDVTGVSIRWLGWRERGGQLVRVTHTVNRQPQYARNEDGSTITIPKPKLLRYIGVHSINNGLTYNLIPKNAASTEAAGRIIAVAEVTGNSMGGDNAYWTNASEKHIAACIELFRQVEGPLGRECSVNEIQKFTTNEQYLNHYITRLKEVIRTKQQLGASEYEIMLMRNLEDYFTGEWLKHDPKTKGNIMSCVTNLFGDVTRNEQLIKTFCQPSRFSFETCLNEGKIYTLVLSAYPNAQMLIGTCMKLDFQQVVLKRTQAAPINKNRFLMFLADEYQFFITTSGGGKAGGDDKFLSVSRQSKIFNLICTQAKTSLLAVQRDENKIDAFLQCFGSRVFLQNLDEKTNKFAEQTLGQIWAEKWDFSGPDLKLSSAVSERTGSATRRQEKQNRFDASYFTQLAPFEAVIFNKEQTRQRIVTSNLKPKYFWDKQILAKAANNYYQAYIENRAHELGISHLFNPVNNVQTQHPKEKAARERSILRSWRNGLPIRNDAQEEPAAQNQDPQPQPTAQVKTTLVSVDNQDDMENVKQKLRYLPDFEEALQFLRIPDIYVDRIASENSDPFHDKNGSATKTPVINEPTTPNRDRELDRLLELTHPNADACKPNDTPNTELTSKRILANIEHVFNLEEHPHNKSQ